MKTDLAPLKRRIADVLTDHGADRVPERDGFAPMKCPYHEDSNASASVSTGRGYFNCHGCGVKGDVFALIMHKEGVDFKTALQIVEDRYSNGVPAAPAARTPSRRPARKRPTIRL